MANRRNPYDSYRKPHDGQSVWGGMVPTPKNPDIHQPYDPYRIPGDPGSDYLKHQKPDEDNGGLGMVRRPTPSPMKPSSGMTMSIPRGNGGNISKALEKEKVGLW